MSAAGWPDQTIADLLALWEEGLSASTIGRRIGKSKNAVIGKAHRLGLPSRPTPIQPPAPPKPQPVRVKRTSLPSLPSVAAAPVVHIPSPRPSRMARETCRWVLSAPGERPLLFCEDAAVSYNKPYCAAHCALAYVPHKRVA